MKNKLLVSMACATLLSSFVTFADDGHRDKDKNFWNTQNCVGSVWTDSSGNPISIEDKFGPGTMEVTRCLANKKVKILYQINTECKDASCTAPYAVGNIWNQIKDMEITHGMDQKDYEVVAIVHGAGWKLVLNDDRNAFRTQMAALVAHPRVKVLFCQNTAHKKGIKLADMIPGMGFVTAGVSAIADLQEEGYRYVQP